jgi:hypothetical protein
MNRLDDHLFGWNQRNQIDSAAGYKKGRFWKKSSFPNIDMRQNVKARSIVKMSGNKGKNDVCNFTG